MKNLIVDITNASGINSVSHKGIMSTRGEAKMKISEIEEENETLRGLLWSRHGCPFPALYGDDGEMQCHACGLDFKRDSAQRISEVFTVAGMKKLEEYMKNRGKDE